MLYHDILFLNLQPQQDKNSPVNKYRQKIAELQTVQTGFEPAYNVNFPAPLNPKCAYYQKLIDNECNRYINTIIDLVDQATSDQQKVYWVHMTLTRKITDKFSEISKLITANDYNIRYIDLNNTTPHTDPHHRTETYIYQLLKTYLVRMYLEIQELYPHYLKEDPLTIEEIYPQLLQEPVPRQAHIRKVEVVEPAMAQDPKVEYAKPIETTLHSFTYKQFLTDSDKLTDLHDSLKKSNFIAQDTNLATFKKAFSGKEITSPVKWTGNMSEFYYFIKLIYTEHKLVEDLKQKHWEVACKCFVREDGSEFDRSKLRGLKRPNTTGDLLAKAVEHIK